MRYKRENTLALDVSSVPTGHRLAIVQPLLTFLKLDTTKLKSVQFHSSRNKIFIGLPDDRSASATATRTPRFSITIEGTKHYVPLEFVDEDIVEVRVRDLPPETPTDVIHQTLRQYGEVLSVISEVWRDFFPGVPTGVKIARMKVIQKIPARITIGNSSALICYDGQPTTVSNNRASKVSAPVTEQTDKVDPRQLGAKQAAKKQQPQHQATKITDPPGESKMELGESSSSEFTTVVSRRRGKGSPVTEQQQQPHHQQQQQQPHPRPAQPALDEFSESLRAAAMETIARLEKAAEKARREKREQEQQQRNK